MSSQSLRWSSAHLFNDPFELSHLSQPDFSPDKLLQSIIKEAISMLFGPIEPSGKSNRLVAAVARWREEERFGSEEEAEQVLSQLLGQIAQQQQQSIDSYMAAWQQFSSALRVCSFSDKPTNRHAWQRYGENHAGIALRFNTGEGTALPEPRKVSYSTIPPLITSLKQQVAVTYGRENPPSPQGFIAGMLNKSKDNNIEREWRCFCTDKAELSTDDQLWHSQKEFSEAELKAVYLGLMTSQQNKSAVIKLVKEKYKGTKVYQAEKLPNRYEIDFVQVGTR
jgi:hypothetical protein